MGFSRRLFVALGRARLACKRERFRKRAQDGFERSGDANCAPPFD
jgi:hypothetical protein